MSEETLAWNTPDQSDPKWAWLKDVVETREHPPEDSDRIVFKWNGNLSRHEIFELQEKNRHRVWRRVQGEAMKHALRGGLHHQYVRV